MILTTSQTSSEDIQWDFTTTAGDNYYQVFHFTTYGAKSAKLTYQKKIMSLQPSEFEYSMQSAVNTTRGDNRSADIIMQV